MHIGVTITKQVNKQRDKTRCPTCRAVHKTVSHFLLHCLGCMHERWILDQQVQKKNHVTQQIKSLGQSKTYQAASKLCQHKPLIQEIIHITSLLPNSIFTPYIILRYYYILHFTFLVTCFKRISSSCDSSTV